MSFRNRLTVFFIVLVILPMVVVAAVGFVLASDSEQGKTDARLSEAQRAGSGLFREFQDRAQASAGVIGHDTQLSAAIHAGKRAAIQKRLNALAGGVGAVRTTTTLEGAGRFETGRGDAVAPARTRLIDDNGRSAGLLTVSVISARDYAALVRRGTRAHLGVRGPRGMVVTTLPAAATKRLPEKGDVNVNGSTLRLTGFDGPAFGGGRLAVRLLAQPTTGGLSASALEVLAILLAALIAAFAFA